MIDFFENEHGIFRSEGQKVYKLIKDGTYGTALRWREGAWKMTQVENEYYLYVFTKGPSSPLAHAVYQHYSGGE